MKSRGGGGFYTYMAGGRGCYLPNLGLVGGHWVGGSHRGMQVRALLLETPTKTTEDSMQC